ncbi:hypothetical protein CCMSSC00406_0007411 [Pleurotus cornucopiae]|uniref:Uncharacterized protein n=1 Tax=Pleurotus cornucopiae TaxID=5321 RepID=A0ACB7J746_PLECO|nr:hypothetical protein CCMSSC00406_0007411 [Pleurotus cornucopiae]
MSAREDGPPRTGKTPLPYRQLFIVSLLQGSEPLTSSIIFPFVNRAVRESGITGGDETKTGYYAGAITHPDIISREKLARSIKGGSTTGSVPPSESTPLLTPSPSSSSLAPSSSSSSPSSPSYSIKTLLHTPSILFSLINLAFLAFADQSTQVILPLSFSTPMSLYGLAFPPYTIGVTLGVFGLLNGLYQILVLPLLTRRFGFKGVHRFAFGVGLTGVFLGYVAIGDGVRIRGEVDRVVWALIVLLLSFMAQYSMAWGEFCTSPFKVWFSAPDVNFLPRLYLPDPHSDIAYTVDARNYNGPWSDGNVHHAFRGTLICIVALRVLDADAGVLSYP